MKIIQHRLHDDAGNPFDFEQSPNAGGVLTPEYLVIHYTAGSSAGQSIDWFKNPAAKASAHVVIARDGEITQLVPFDRVAWHAGASSWEGRSGLNRYSIGIELDNAGRLQRQGNTWRAWFGREYDEQEVVEAIHKHETSSSGWHTYTEAQIDSTLGLALLLMSEYTLLDIVGHDDIAPKRKSDPGPAFPMDSMRAKLLGRSDDALPLYTTTVKLNIRSGPGIQYFCIPTGPLPIGTMVEIVSRRADWCFVNVLDDAGSRNCQGWVFGLYLRRSAGRPSERARHT